MFVQRSWRVNWALVEIRSTLKSRSIEFLSPLFKWESCVCVKKICALEFHLGFGFYSHMTINKSDLLRENAEGRIESLLRDHCSRETLVTGLCTELLAHQKGNDTTGFVTGWAMTLTCHQRQHLLRPKSFPDSTAQFTGQQSEIAFIIQMGLQKHVQV